MKNNISIDDYKAILRNDPNNYPAKQNIVNEYIKNGKTKKAIEFLEQCLNENRYDVFSYFILGNVYLSTKEYTKSIKNFERARQIKPASTEIINNLGMSYYNLGDYNKAENCFNKCIEIKSDHYISYSNIAKISFKKESYNEAIDLYSKALSFSNEHIESLEGIGLSYYKIGEFKLAIKYLLKLQKYKNNDENLSNIIGICYFNTNQIKNAVYSFEQSIKINPQSEVAIKNISISYQRINKGSERGVEYSMKLLKINPESYEYLKIFCDCAESITLENSISKNTEFKNNLIRVYENKDIDSKSISNITIDILKKPILSKTIEDFINNYNEKDINYKLYSYLLTEGFIISPYLEIFSKKLRNHFLNLFKSNKKNLISSDRIETILFSLAQQAFLNEYLWTHSKKEGEIFNNLLEYIAKNKSNYSKTLIYLLASYQYIGNFNMISRICLKYNGKDNNFLKFIDLQIRNPIKENKILKDIKSFSKIKDRISLKVQSQYELNPYPRWTRITLGEKRNYNDYINQQIHPNFIDSKKINNLPNLLIAGCGTGRHTLYTASSVNANITSIDISKASLAYAKRESDKRNIKDIKFIQGDILDANKIDMKFDIIESIGVLHHMEDPDKGIESLLRVLKPGGFIKLGLYSKTARRNIQYFREKITKDKVNANAESIKKFRDKIFHDESKISNSVKKMADFYSLSEFRDLIFHYQEKQYEIKDIEKILGNYNLSFLGFENKSNRVSKYLTNYPEDEKLINLENWKKYELNNPNTFLGMYNFWCYKN